MGILDIPEWLREYAARWMEHLGLHAWRVGIEVCLVVEEHASTFASSHIHNGIVEAEMHFRADLEENQFWQETVIHEFIHLAHARVSEVVQDVIIEGLPIDQRAMALRAYELALEPFIEQLSRTLWRLDQEELMPLMEAAISDAVQDNEEDDE